MGYNTKKEGLVTEAKREIWQIEKGQKEERNHCSSVGKEMTAHDIRVAGHNTLLNKAIRAIGINRPRDIWRIIGLTGSRSPLLQFPTLEVMTNKKEIKE